VTIKDRFGGTVWPLHSPRSLPDPQCIPRLWIGSTRTESSGHLGRHLLHLAAREEVGNATGGTKLASQRLKV